MSMVKVCKPKGGVRPGVWRCRQDRYTALPNSLAIAHHLRRLRISEENGGEVRHIPRGEGCTVEDIWFDCEDHGEEAA